MFEFKYKIKKIKETYQKWRKYRWPQPKMHVRIQIEIRKFEEKYQKWRKFRWPQPEMHVRIQIKKKEAKD